MSASPAALPGVAPRRALRALSGLGRASARPLRLVAAATVLGTIAIVVTAVLAGITAAAVLGGALALGAFAAACLAVGSLALVARRRLAELRHLPDLGRRFVTNHDEGRITEVTEAPGHLTVHLASEHVQTVVMDEHGSPDHTVREAELSHWRLPTRRMSPQQVADLKRLLTAETSVSVVTSGVVGLTGPVTEGWRLCTESGLVVTSGTAAG